MNRCQVKLNYIEFGRKFHGLLEHVIINEKNIFIVTMSSKHTLFFLDAAIFSFYDNNFYAFLDDAP